MLHLPRRLIILLLLYGTCGLCFNQLLTLSLKLGEEVILQLLRRLVVALVFILSVACCMVVFTDDSALAMVSRTC